MTAILLDHHVQQWQMNSNLHLRLLLDTSLIPYIDNDANIRDELNK